MPTGTDFEAMRDWCAVCDDSHNVDCEDAGHPTLVSNLDVRWTICDRCAGDGTLRGYPGVYTSADFDEDPEFAEAYLTHQRPCDDCDGTGKVQTFTDEALSRPAVAAWLREMWESEAVSRQERMMGA